MTTAFIAKHGLWTADEQRRAAALKTRVEKEGLRLVRLAWSDAHGYVRAKAVTVPVFFEALAAGYNINVATTTLDSANARTFSSFTRGGGHGARRDDRLAEHHDRARPGDVPRPALGARRRMGALRRVFQQRRALPLLAAARAAPAARAPGAAGLDYVVGLEIEWYLARVAEDHLTEEHVGVPGVRGRPIATWPVEPGYSYHSESNLDLMQPVLPALAEALQALGLPLRSVENEWGPGQVECTFSAQPALKRRRRPGALPHRDAAGLPPAGPLRDLHVPPRAEGLLLERLASASIAGRRTDRRQPIHAGARRRAAVAARRGFLGGLLAHAAPATAFATPTVNGYRRFKPNSLAPDRAGWGYDHRGAMIRVLGGVGDPATRMENRGGEPAANPYLYMASQLVSGRDGIEHATIRDRRTTSRTRPTARRCREPAGGARCAGAGARSSAASSATIFLDYYPQG